MRTFAAGVLQRGPRRSQPGNSAGPYRRGEVAAWLCTIVLIVQLLIIPVVVPVSLVLLAIGRLSRWHPAWLLLPLLAGSGWLAAAGSRWAVMTVGPLPGLLRTAADPARLLHDPGAVATALASLSRELPVALVAGAAEAGLLTWLSLRGRDGWRPGLVAAARRWRGRTLLVAGQTVTGAGCAIGLDARTGALAGLSWAEAERGVLLTGTEPGDFGTIALAVACAAMRRRKTVLALDFEDAGGREAATLTHSVARLARALAIPVSRVARPDELRRAAGRAVRARDVVLASGPGALLTPEMTSLLEWLRDRDLRGDSLLCLSGCETVDPALLAVLLALGPSTGTAILAATTSPECAGALSEHTRRTVVACGPVSEELAARLISAAVLTDTSPSPHCDTLARQQPGEFAVISAGCLRPGYRAVPIVTLDGRARVRSGGARRAAAVPTAAGSA